MPLHYRLELLGNYTKNCTKKVQLSVYLHWRNWIVLYVLFIQYFRLLFFGILVTLVAWYLSLFFLLAHLVLQNVNKDYVIFLYFRNFWAFHPIFVTWFLVVFGDQVTKILHNSLFTFFTEQGKTGKNGTHGNKNIATYFWYFGSFDEKRTYENM